MPANNAITPNIEPDTPKQAPVAGRGKLKRAGGTHPSPQPAKRTSNRPRGTGYEKAKLDAYGLREGSLKSQAAALYASKHGATIPEVTDKIGSRQFNVIQELEGRGYKFERTQESGAGKRPVTRFRLLLK